MFTVGKSYSYDTVKWKFCRMCRKNNIDFRKTCMQCGADLPDRPSTDELKLTETINQVDSPYESEPVDHSRPYEYDGHEPKRRIILFFTAEEFPEIQAKFKHLKSVYRCTTESEVVKKLFEMFESAV